MKKQSDQIKNDSRDNEAVKRRYPRFSAIRPTKSGTWIVFSLNETCQILVSTAYLERILETAKKRNGEAA